MENLTDYEYFTGTTIDPRELVTGLLLNISAENASKGSSLNPRTGPDPAFALFRDESRFWVQKVLLIIVGVVGLFGNAATIVVLTRRVMRSSTNAYLTALATSDFLYLVCMLWLSVMHYSSVHEPNFSFYWYVWPYAVWLTDASSNTSVWLILSFTVERYIAVCHPMRRSSMCTESRARRVIMIVYACCFCATLTTPFEWSIEEKFDPTINGTRLRIAFSELGENEIYKSIYYWFTSMTFMLLPLTLLIFFNSFLIMSVKRSRSLRTKMTQNVEGADGSSHHEVKITITLIAVVMMFLLCQLPTAFTLIYTSFYQPEYHSNEEALLRGLGNIFNLLVCINAACNFILYCALSDKYRRTFGQTFLPCFFKAQSPLHSMFYSHTSPPDDRMASGFRRSASVRNSMGKSTAISPSASGLHRQNTLYLAIPTHENKRRNLSTSDNRTKTQPSRGSSPTTASHSRSSSLTSEPKYNDIDNKQIQSTNESETTTALLPEDQHSTDVAAKKQSLLCVNWGSGKELQLNGLRRNPRPTQPNIQITISNDETRILNASDGGGSGTTSL